MGKVALREKKKHPTERRGGREITAVRKCQGVGGVVRIWVKTASSG